MSNSPIQLQQFERNRYFYGKLLSVKDFQLEQNYYIEKRSLLNRLIHGTGVIGGLHLSQIDGTGIRLTPGTAIDSSGREIVVASNLDVADISKLAGYPPAYAGGVLYAAISYDEIAREPVPPVSNATASTDGIELNKIRETFKFTLTTEKPAASSSLESIYRQTVTAFENEQFIVYRSVPRFANPGDVIEVVLTVRTKLQQSGTALVEVAESLPSQFTMLSAWKDNKIPFHLGGLAGGVERTQRYYARAGEMPTSGVISGQLLFNSVLQTGATVESSLAVVEDRSIVRLLAERYFEQQADAPASDHIVLAAITINNKGNITAIDESVRPFIFNNELLFQLMIADKQRPAQLPTHAASHADGGADELNVTNLSGVLADPQKVLVQDEGSSLTVRAKLNFTGAGVTASDDATNGRTNIHIPGMTTHAASHAKGGADELNVTNLSGVLADPQKVVVQDEGTALPARSRINFIGPGVTAVDDAAGGRINVTISGAAASHAGTHAKGGTDELNVNNLSGTLADPQKVIVQKDGTAFTARTKINFTGSGVSVSDDSSNGRINVNITGGSQTAGAQIATGSIVFQSMYPGEVRVSPFITHPLPNNVGIILSVVQSIGLDGLPDETSFGGLPTSLLPNRLVEGEAKAETALSGATDQSNPISQTPGNQSPPTVPDPIFIPRLNSTVKTGDAALMEPDLPYVMAQYPAAGNVGFQVKIQDRRDRMDINAVDWTVRWWAVSGTVDTGTVTVPAYSSGNALTGGGKLDDVPAVKLPTDFNPPIIKLPVDDLSVIKQPNDDTPIIKVPTDGTPIIRTSIEQAEELSSLRVTDNTIKGDINRIENAAAERLTESEAVNPKLTGAASETVKKTRRSSKAAEQPNEPDGKS
ncbi:hypothetical protein [Paenibacillus xylaniclasticus]|uniref:hypothetical protein n=1 Tax=Paenibacillus xylaniclasticus TaxID=588083 RepID=UPI000FDBD041|nr:MULTISPECIES: hypothetical protein [Paenibacillus]